MTISERDFIVKHWQPKENRFVTAFTKFLPNLGYNSSKRAESIHPVTTTSKPSVLRQCKIPRMRKGKKVEYRKVNHKRLCATPGAKPATTLVSSRRWALSWDHATT
jgi:hypothetical protein